MNIRLYLVIACAGFLFSCGSSSDDNPAPPPAEKERIPLLFSFSESAQGFEIEVADYQVEHEDNDKIISKISQLPEPYEYRKGIEFGWFNYSADIKGYIKKRIDVLSPSTMYDVNFKVDILTIESEECSGAGGGPGSSVQVKSSILPSEPNRFISNEGDVGTYRVDINDGQGGGEDVVYLGSIGLPISCEAHIESPTWEIKTLSNSESFSMSTGSTGEAWIYVSIDSGFEGATTVYITDVEIEFEER
ncbi:hypothetical protein [Alteromonas lipotrueiana]|uniref:hypothetical protein n=1 Tax=Alteromonas lipotrueiana TaxID=2803815 RepID=UPI001C489DD5|nr:hypothetical protein [Alteromonas lipotrueiana]